MNEMTPETLTIDINDVACRFCGALEDQCHLADCRGVAVILAWQADRDAAEWKRAFDEGEAHGMKAGTMDFENPHPEGSNRFCGWSFGFWGSRDRKRVGAVEEEIDVGEAEGDIGAHRLHELRAALAPQGPTEAGKEKP